MRCSLLLISSPPLYIVPELLSQEPVWDSARSHLRCNLITFIVTSQVLVAFTTSEPALVNDQRLRPLDSRDKIELVTPHL